MKQTNSKKQNYIINQNFSLEMQPVAIEKHYKKIWPGVSIFELDLDIKNELSRMIDIGGADKMLRFGNHNVAFLAQRFRQFNFIKYDEFTIRFSEFTKAMTAISEDRFLPSFYSYGFANKEMDDFLKLYILKYKDLLIYMSQVKNLNYRINLDKTKFYHIKFNKLPHKVFLYKWNIQQSFEF